MAKYMSLSRKAHNYLKANFKISNVLNVQTFLKIGFIYTCAILFSFHFFVKFSEGSIKSMITQKDLKPVIMIVNSTSHLGESMVHERLKKTLPSMGYHSISVEYPLDMQDLFLFRHFIKTAADIASLLFKPEFNLALSHYLHIIPNGYNVVYLNVPRDLIFANSLKFLSVYDHLYNYDAYLDLYTYVNNKENTLLKNQVGDKAILTGYIANNYKPFQSIEPNYALISGSLWGCGRGSIRFFIALHRLANEGLLRAQGNQIFANLGSAYDGMLQTDNVYDAEEELNKSIQKAGIYLMVHNTEHSNDNMPTSRISEAAANSALAISDMHPFIIEHFGNSVLYFDMNQNEETIYRTLKKHIEFAKNNPEKALEMKKKAHKIFAEKFSMEVQLKSIFEQIQKAKNESQIK